jgi:hypothetical protein
MSEPLSNLPPLPEPFAVAPRTLRAQGCGRGALIGCGVLIAIFGIAAVGLTLKADEMLVWILHRLEEKVAAKLPADLTPVERQRFSAAFEDLYASVGKGKVDPVAVQSLQRELFAVSGQVETGLSREQVVRLTAAVEAAAGKAPPQTPGGAPAAGGPLPAPSPSG